MRDRKKAEELAAQRVQLLSPLLAEGLDPPGQERSGGDMRTDRFVRPHFEKIFGEVCEGRV